jgi:ABC-type dipeptide/oligopeptide/nickel transport system permease subunit
MLVTEPVAGEAAAPVAAEGEAVPGKRRSSGQLRDIWRRYKRNRLAVGGLIVVGLLVVLAIAGPFIAPYDPKEQNLLNTIEPPLFLIAMIDLVGEHDPTGKQRRPEVVRWAGQVLTGLCATSPCRVQCPKP